MQASGRSKEHIADAIIRFHVEQTMPRDRAQPPQDGAGHKEKRGGR